MLNRAPLWFTLLIALVSGSSAFAGGLSLSRDPGFPYHVKADALSYDELTKTYTARGHVTITRGDQVLSADAVELNMETMDVRAFGNVRFQSGQDRLEGERVDMNLDAGTGILYEGSLFIKESHFYISGAEIEKSGDASYHIADGCFTTCDGDSPAWQIKAKDATVEVEGYGKLKRAAFYAKSVPLIYMPYLLFPTSTKRQTGFLIPQYSQSNKKGFEYSQPFFWALSENADATLYETYMSHRGFKHGVEFRYALSPRDGGAAMFDYLNDRERDDGTGSGFQGYTGDDEDRTNKGRWWFRAKADQELVAGFNAKLDLDVVSDQDYLREFKTGYSGFRASDDYFEKQFGRDLDDHTETVRLNQLNINRNWSLFSLNTDLRWYDDVIIRKNDDPDPTMQRLPHIRFDGAKQTLFSLPLYFDLESSCDYLWRDHGARGYIASLHPRFYYPFRILKYFDFEPSAGFRETIWYIEKFEDEPLGSGNRFSSNEAPDFKADLSTDVTRVFHMDGKSLSKLKHSIRPQVVYNYVHVPSESDRPNFAGADPSESYLEDDWVYDSDNALKDVNLITYSITNFFSTKSLKPEKTDKGEQPDATAEKSPPSHEYNDFCRVRFSQSYNINKAGSDSGDKRKQPFSDIRGEIELRPHRHLNLDGDVSWNAYDTDFTSYNALLAVSDKRGDRAWVDYRYTRDCCKNIRTRLLAQLFGPFSATWEYDRNLKDSKAEKMTVGLRYAHQCWSLAISYTDDREIDEQKYFVEIGLVGLGQIGF